MKIILLLFLLVAVLAQDKRLIQFNETSILWMTVEEVEKLAECGHGVHFMDITDHPSLSGYPKPKKFAFPSAPSHQELVNSIIALIDPDEIVATITSMAAYSPSRFYTTATGVTSSNWLASRYRSIAQQYGRSDVEVENWAHSWPQPSVVARVTGTTYPNEKVIVGGHIDSTAGGGGNNRAPGADDDASGSATVLEIFRSVVASNHRPERTLEFHGYAAEEVGLLGSQDIAQYYLNQNEDVVAMMQLDMDGYTDGSTYPTIGCVTDFTNAQLTNFIRQIITTYIGSGEWTNTACGYACSDHASWYRAGYDASFIFESTFGNSNPYIHSAQDTLARLNPQHMEKYAVVGTAYCVELSFKS